MSPGRMGGSLHTHRHGRKRGTTLNCRTKTGGLKGGRGDLSTVGGGAALGQKLDEVLSVVSDHQHLFPSHDPPLLSRRHATPPPSMSMYRNCLDVTPCHARDCFHAMPSTVTLWTSRDPPRQGLPDTLPPGPVPPSRHPPLLSARHATMSPLICSPLVQFAIHLYPIHATPSSQICNPPMHIAMPFLSGGHARRHGGCIGGGAEIGSTFAGGAPRSRERYAVGVQGSGERGKGSGQFHGVPTLRTGRGGGWGGGGPFRRPRRAWRPWQAAAPPPPRESAPSEATPATPRGGMPRLRRQARSGARGGPRGRGGTPPAGRGPGRGRGRGIWRGRWRGGLRVR